MRPAQRLWPDAASDECWLAFGGSPRPATKKKEDKGFFGNFVAQIAENAGGVKDTRKRTSGATRSRHDGHRPGRDHVEQVVLASMKYSRR